MNVFLCGKFRNAQIVYLCLKSCNNWTKKFLELVIEQIRCDLRKLSKLGKPGRGKLERVIEEQTRTDQKIHSTESANIAMSVSCLEIGTFRFSCKWKFYRT